MADRYESLSVDQLRTDLGTHDRVCVSAEAKRRYIEAQNAGAVRPEGDPVVAFWDGKRHILAAGFHWVTALREREGGKAKIRVLVKDGDAEDALMYTAPSDLTHGLPLTAEDKRHKVSLILQTKKWGQESTKTISDMLHVSQGLVESVRRGMRKDESELGKPAAPEAKRRGKDNKQYRARKKPEEKNGAVVFDWKAYSACYGALMRQVDLLGNAYHCKESLDAKGLRRLLKEWDTRFRKLYTAKSKLKAPED